MRAKGSELLWGLLFGMVFGFLLHKGGATNYDVIVGQLLLTDFTVLKIMLSAVVVGAIGAGRLDALAGGLPGILLGSWLFAVAYPRAKDGFLRKGAFQKITLPELLRLPRWAVIGLLSAGIAVLLAMVERAGLGHPDGVRPSFLDVLRQGRARDEAIDRLLQGRDLPEHLQQPPRLGNDHRAHVLCASPENRAFFCPSPPCHRLSMQPHGCPQILRFS